MGQPKGYLTLSPSQYKKYILLSSKIELKTQEIEDLAFLDNKRNLYLNPPILSVGAENYLVDVYSRERFGIKRASSGGLGKSTQIKGFVLEKEGIELLSKIDGVAYEKQIGSVSDDYFIGLCDTICPQRSKVIEIKTSWNAANFMKNKKENFKLPNEIWGQVQGYLHLYNIPKGQVCYVLVNTPSHLIEQEWANLFKRYSYGEVTREKYDEGCYKLEGLFDYNKIPEKKRVIRFDVEYSLSYIQRAQRKVDMAREWLNDFEKRFMSTKNLKTYADRYLHNTDTETEE